MAEPRALVRIAVTAFVRAEDDAQRTTRRSLRHSFVPFLPELVAPPSVSRVNGADGSPQPHDSREENTRMPNTKNHTNRIRKARREGLQGDKANSAPNKRAVARMRPGEGDLPRGLPAATTKRKSTLGSKRKVKRKTAKA
jgi:hypothetical protein